MNRRREIMRVAGWMAVISGFVFIALAAVTQLEWADLAGGYGVMLVLAGAWTVTGLEMLKRHERRMVQAQAATRVTPSRQSATTR